MKEKKYRSITKCLTWRATALADTTLLAFLFTGHPLQALTIGGAEFFTKSALYYLHERVWLRVVRWKDRASATDASWRESHAHSVGKTLTWRFVGSIDTFIIALFVTGDLGISASIGVVEILTKSVLFYLHERVWLRSSWGTEHHKQTGEPELHPALAGR
jgi:uncharacterized membrane protein